MRDQDHRLLWDGVASWAEALEQQGLSATTEAHYVLAARRCAVWMAASPPTHAARLGRGWRAVKGTSNVLTAERICPLSRVLQPLLGSWPHALVSSGTFCWCCQRRGLLPHMYGLVLLLTMPRASAILVPSLHSQ